jgi:hypothetical protein
MSRMTRRYTGDPSPLPEASQVAATIAPEPFRQEPNTSANGNGVGVPSWVAPVQYPIIGTPREARSWLGLLPASLAWVATRQASGLRRLLGHSRIGAYDQSSTPTAPASQRIARPTAGPWDRGTAVGDRQ